MVVLFKPIFFKNTIKLRFLFLNAMHQGRNASKWCRAHPPVHELFPQCFGDSRATPSSLAYWLSSKRPESKYGNIRNIYQIYLNIHSIHTSISHTIPYRITPFHQPTKAGFFSTVKIHHFFGTPWCWSKPGRNANTTFTPFSLELQKNLKIDTPAPVRRHAEGDNSHPFCRSFTQASLILLSMNELAAEAGNFEQNKSKTSYRFKRTMLQKICNLTPESTF